MHWNNKLTCRAPDLIFLTQATVNYDNVDLLELI